MLKKTLYHHLLIIALAGGLSFGLAACMRTGAPSLKPVYTLNILHMNDTHSHVDPEDWTVNINGRDTKIALGGFTRMMSALAEERGKRENTLVLHGGDAFQGTLYFVHYEGAADRDFLNLFNIDAMAAGNHEFDKGPAFLARFARTVRFPILSANTEIDPAGDLAGKILPYTIKEVGGQKIGIIGLTTVETKHSSSPGGQVVFTDPVAAADKYCRELAGRDINKIIVLSHLGFETDRILAKTVRGIDVIVGGHSHTPIGTFNRFAIDAVDPCPWVEKGPDGINVPIVQAWEWAKVLGRITLSFDADGRVIAYEGMPQLIVGCPFRQRWKDVNGDGRIDGNDPYSEVTPEEAPDRYEDIVRHIESSGQARMWNDHQEAKILHDHYARGLYKMRKTVVAAALEPLDGAGSNSGAGPLVADSMLRKTKSFGAVMAVENVRALRGDIAKGDITAGQIYELLPFRNSLVIIDLSAAEIKSALEEAIAKSHEKWGYGMDKYLYVAGVRFRVDLAKPMGERIFRIEVMTDGVFRPLMEGSRYKVVTNSFLAAGGDNYGTFKAALSKQDTGFIDSDVFLEYVTELKTLKNPIEKRVVVEDLP
ncbi:MAG: 5'-nucleotidase C-terminal domain-containing protein [Deltaproteobacteria bacterium]|nr:5'-nucleotidase C-terminal domain-containing protein [Deltaproteobacteria bacterium]